MIYTNKELKALIKQGESLTIEFKTSFQKEVIESVVAFANARGGTIKWYLENQWWVNEVASGDYQKYYDEMYGNR